MCTSRVDIKSDHETAGNIPFQVLSVYWSVKIEELANHNA